MQTADQMFLLLSLFAHPSLVIPTDQIFMKYRRIIHFTTKLNHFQDTDWPEGKIRLKESDIFVTFWPSGSSSPFFPQIQNFCKQYNKLGITFLNRKIIFVNLL